MNCILVTRTPISDIPELVRQAFVGLRLPVIEPEPAGLTELTVHLSVALDILEYYNPAAADMARAYVAILGHSTSEMVLVFSWQDYSLVEDTPSLNCFNQPLIHER